MSLSIEVNAGELGAGFVQSIRAAAEATLQDQGMSDGALAIELIDESRIQALNHEFAGLDEPTDVLAFPAGDRQPDTGMMYLGDVAICPTIASRSAARGRHSLQDELTLLTIHGVLHLLEFDHDQQQRKQEMWKAQSRVLARLGIALEVR